MRKLRLAKVAEQCLVNIYKETSRLTLTVYFTILDNEPNREKAEALEDAINIAIRLAVNKLTDINAYSIIGNGALALLAMLQENQTF